MATTATKLKIAKTKPAPHKILPAEYRRAHFWDSSTTSVFQTAIPPLLAPTFFSSAEFIPHNEAIFMPFCRLLWAAQRLRGIRGDEVFRCVHVLRFVLKEC
jgi:hypothetical protein